MKHQSGRAFSFVLLAVVGAVAAQFTFHHIKGNERWVGYLQLMQKGSTCRGVVTRSDPESSCLAEYSFTVGDKNFAGSGQGCGMRVGEMVTITYLADDPRRSCLGSPAGKLADELTYALFGDLSFPSAF